MFRAGAATLAAAICISACSGVTKLGRSTAGIEPPVSEHFAQEEDIEGLDRELDALERAIELQYYSARGPRAPDNSGPAVVPEYPTSGDPSSPNRVQAVQEAQRRIVSDQAPTEIDTEWLRRLASGRKRQVDMLCGRFFYSLNDASDGAGFTRNSINIFTNTLTTLMGLFEAQARDIAVVSGIQLGVNDWQSELEQLLLFTPSPEALHSLVDEEQRRFLANNLQLWTEPGDIEQVREFVEGYAHHCTPMGIRATLEQTIQERVDRNSTDPERNTVLAVQRDALASALRRIAGDENIQLDASGSSDPFNLTEASLAYLLWWATAFDSDPSSAEADNARTETLGRAPGLRELIGAEVDGSGVADRVAEQTLATIGTVEPLVAESQRLARTFNERRSQRHQRDLVLQAQQTLSNHTESLVRQHPSCADALFDEKSGFVAPQSFPSIIERDAWLEDRRSDLQTAVDTCNAPGADAQSDRADSE